MWPRNGLPVDSCEPGSCAAGAVPHVPGQPPYSRHQPAYRWVLIRPRAANRYNCMYAYVQNRSAITLHVSHRLLNVSYSWKPQRRPDVELVGKANCLLLPTCCQPWALPGPFEVVPLPSRTGKRVPCSALGVREKLSHDLHDSQLHAMIDNHALQWLQTARGSPTSS